MISPSSTNPKVTQVGDYIFRVCFIDPFQGQVMADFAMQHLKAKTAAILRDQKSDYSMGLADFFIKRFKEKGGTIVARPKLRGGRRGFQIPIDDHPRARNPTLSSCRVITPKWA